MLTLENPQYTTELWKKHTDLEKEHKELISHLEGPNKPIEGVSPITKYVYLPYDTDDHHGSLNRYFNKNKFVGFLDKKDPAELMEVTKLYSNPKEVRDDGVLRGAVYMREAYELSVKTDGNQKDTRREPILIDETPLEDDDPEKNGRHNILDGHSTYANALKAGWPMVYVYKINNAHLNAAKKHLKIPTNLQDPPEPQKELEGHSAGGYFKYKYKSRRYKRKKHYSKKNKHYSKKNKRKYR